jgi:transposase
MEISTIGFDLAKRVFQVHAVDAAGRVVLQRKLRRSAVTAFFAGLPPCLIGMEACGSAHYWARALSGLGHRVKLLPPGDVRAYVRRNKTDAADAAAICEAVTRPRLRGVAVKTPAQQAVAVQHRVRALLVGQRTALINALRGHLSEFGIVAARGPGGVRELVAALAEATEDELPEPAGAALKEIVAAIAALEARIARIDRAIVAANKANGTARRLLTVPAVGPIGASAFAGLVGDPSAFRSGREFAAWLGLTPREHSSGGAPAPRPNLQKGRPLPAPAARRRGHLRSAPARQRRAGPRRLDQGSRGQKAGEARHGGARQQDRPHRLGRHGPAGNLQAHGASRRRTGRLSPTTTRDTELRG